MKTVTTADDLDTLTVTNPDRLRLAFRQGDIDACLALENPDDEERIDVQGLTGFPLAIRSCPTGKGVFATRHIQPGEIVLEAAIDSLAKERTDTSFELWPGGRHAHLTWPAWRINHSCAPNCGVRPRPDKKGGGYDFIAGPDGIPAGAEIRTHYGLHEWISRAVPGGACKCGAPTCEGRSKGWGEMTEPERAALAPFAAAPYLREPSRVRHFVVAIELEGVQSAPETASAWRGLITRLVKRCGLQPHGEPLLDDYGTGLLSGWTFAQLVNASSLTGHFYRFTHQARVDIVSCRAFDADTVAHWLAQQVAAAAYHVITADRP